MKKLLLYFIITLYVSFIYSQNTVIFSLLPKEEYEALPSISSSELIKYTKTNLTTKDAAQIIILASPTPGNQGSQGSCGAWACSYAAQTILGHSKFGNIENAKRSPSFVYNQMRLIHDKMYISNILEFLKNNGSCHYNEMPYNQYDYTTQPSNNLKFDAGLNTITDWRRLSSTNNVEEIKGSIRLGLPVIFSIYTTQQFKNMAATDGIWDENIITEKDTIGHACCIIGFDDNKKMFKAINSWGTTSGDNGFFWITYDLVSKGCLEEVFVICDLSEDTYPSVNGSDFICNNEIYSVTNLPTNATTTWSCSTYWGPIVYQTKALLCSEIDDERATFSRNIKNDTLLYTGNATVVAKIKLKNGIEKNFTKSVYAETPIKPNIQKPNQLTASWFVGKSRIIKETDFPILKASNLHWSITTPNGSIIHEHGTKEITFTPTTSGKHIFMVENIYGCGESKFDYLEYNIYPKFIFTYTNPTTDLLEGYVYTEDNINNPNLRATTTLNKERYLGKYDIELFNEQTGYYKKYSFPENSANVNISLTNMIKGSYIIRLIIEGQVVQVSNLLIK